MAKKTKRSGKKRQFTIRKKSVAAYHDGLVRRMNQASDGATLKVIGDKTGANAETVRRYMSNGRVPAQFLCEFCDAFNVEPKWLLTGKGKKR